MVAGDGDGPDFYLGTFIHIKRERERGRRNLLDLRIDRGVLPAALGEKFLQHVGGVLNLVGVVLRLHHQADFALLEAVEDFRFRDRMDAAVMDGADDAALRDDEGDIDRLRALARFRFQADIVEPRRCSTAS